MGFVVDANAIHAFQNERIGQREDIAHAAIRAIFSKSYVALDTGELCLSEWLQCAGGTYPFALKDWVYDQMAEGRIRLHTMASNSCRKHLVALGIPDKDHKWIRLAAVTAHKKLVTEDIDFFDPSQKIASHAAKEKLKESRSGSCARSLRKDYGIDVMCLRHVETECGGLLSTTPTTPPNTPP